MSCECRHWARDKVMLLTKHHPNCTWYNPEQDARGIISDLLNGITAWARDEDGVHDQCFDAFRTAAYFIGRPELVK